MRKYSCKECCRRFRRESAWRDHVDSEAHKKVIDEIKRQIKQQPVKEPRESMAC